MTGGCEPAPPQTWLQIVDRVRPTILISCHTSPTLMPAIPEPAIRTMAKHVQTPVLLALSSPNPELTAAQAYHWTEGRALFANAEGIQEEVATPDGRVLSPSKVQSVYIFPGVALGTAVTRCGAAALL